MAGAPACTSVRLCARLITPSRRRAELADDPDAHSAGHMPRSNRESAPLHPYALNETSCQWHIRARGLTALRSAVDRALHRRLHYGVPWPAWLQAYWLGLVYVTSVASVFADAPGSTAIAAGFAAACQYQCDCCQPHSAICLSTHLAHGELGAPRRRKRGAVRFRGRCRRGTQAPCSVVLPASVSAFASPE